MRVKIYSFLLILVFCSVMLISGSKASLQNETTLNYIDHEPIVIENNSELAAASSSGTGTEIDPYIIEGFNFTTDKDNAITITGTTDFLEIRDCYFLNCLSCVSLYYSSHISFLDNIIKDCAGVITGISAHNLVINNNNVSNCFYGFTLFGDNLTLTNNHLTDTMLNDFTISTNNCDISLNSFSGSRCILFCEETGTVFNNTFLSELEIKESANITLANNIFYQNSANGITLINTVDSSIHHNLFQENTEYGLSIESGSNNEIYQNDFKDNNEGGIQANDDGSSNTWYNTSLSLGNFWSDYDQSGNYSIDGSASSVDLYPNLDQSYIGGYVTPTDDSTEPTDSNDSSFFVFPVIIGLVIIPMLRKKIN